MADSATQPRVWPVGALCRAVADALESRFNPVAVAGEITGFSRAASGHCYFSLKDASGQLRCAMFRRAASLLDFVPRDGDKVELRGRLGVYEPRGELQLIVESLSRAGQGSLFEQFLLLKAKLEAQGLFDPARKRPLPQMPRGIGVVTSLGAAALHDVVTALQRRVPHIPVRIAPASVQGEGAPRELVKALESLYDLAQGKAPRGGQAQPLDVILLVRGGGAMEDLWAFNDEQLAHTIASSPVPIISGVGHETDFTIADFVADLRAPTPTAAAELVSASTESYLRALDEAQARLRKSLTHTLEREAQQVDHISARLGRPSGAMARQRALLAQLQQSMAHGLRSALQGHRNTLSLLQHNLPRAAQQALQRRNETCSRAELRLKALDPARVLQRGYAWLTQPDGRPVTGVGQVQLGQDLQATLADGTVDLRVQNAHRI
ncbi:MAG: exodeoxyribonuclease VII large subunit [Rhodoferax sp.]|nr:exodeoxyribonuclease VII large subunit [Rhodoferax sp.]